jgi:hypothetical protein
MLLQALNSIAGSYNKETNGGVELVGQLSQTTAECDQLLEDLLQIADQIGQITRLLDGHWASALAIALRKVFILLYPCCSMLRQHLVEQQLRPSNV